MSDVTLTVALNDSRPNDKTTFRFSRDQFGEGSWYTTSPTGIKAGNCAVHLTLGSALTSLARARDLQETHNFSRTPPKPVKAEKVPRQKREKKAKASRKTSVPNGMLGGFNPFAMG